jgi:UPF0271 protein
MAELTIDLNADLGESEEALANGSDFELMRYITSANIACGGHAGDEHTMRETVAAAKKLNVAVGAHPSYPDRANFGRLESRLSVSEIEATVQEQVASLIKIAASLGTSVVHVKPHGALYHAAHKQGEIAQALGRAVQELDSKLIVVGQAGSPALEVWRAMGLRCAAEAFADRGYEADGTLRKRSLTGALLEDPSRAAEQAVEIAVQRRVMASDGSQLSVDASTICIHSDTPGSVAIARAVSQRLKAAGVTIRALE